jgi:hypothetical protein
LRSTEPPIKKKKLQLKSILIRYLLVKGGKTTVIEALNAILPGLSIILHLIDNMKNNTDAQLIIKQLME